MKNLKDLTIEQQLLAPFPRSSIRWRIGSYSKDRARAKPLAYISAREVIGRLDDVFGVFGWSNLLTPIYSNGGLVGVKCEITTEVNGRSVTKSDFGAVETVSEFEIKSVASDAIKRAAVHFGVGAYLYELDTPYVPVRNGFFIHDPIIPERFTLEGFLGGHEGYDAPPAPEEPISVPEEPHYDFYQNMTEQDSGTVVSYSDVLEIPSITWDEPSPVTYAIKGSGTN